VWLVLLACTLALAPPTLRAARAACVLARLTAQPGLEPLARRLLWPIEERLEYLPLGAAQVRARRYVPLHAGGDRKGVLLLHGVHPRGIDEPRLREFARALAAGGFTVLTPELPELLAFRFEPSLVARIRQLSAADAARLGQRGVGVIGISFAGGLALLAAASAEPNAIAWVAAIGGHDDLVRVSDFYAGRDVRGPNGERVQVRPHPYGARVMLRAHMARFFEAADLPLAERALDAYLGDRHALARHLAQALLPAGRAIMNVLLSDEPAPAGSTPASSARGAGAGPATTGVAAGSLTVGALLDAVAAEARPQLMAASPRAQLANLHVPVFLLHGADDPIIPSIETRYLAQEIPPPWLRASLITPLLRHAEFPAPPRLCDVAPLVRFIVGIYEAAGSAQALQVPR
jgi:pimeloyl-ACP methyl ester carboxylesterase